jgi:hypothetical protein
MIRSPDLTRDPMGTGPKKQARRSHKLGGLAPALAAFLKRPQAEAQIGAKEEPNLR